jgi:hypothetical protein
MFQMGGGGKPSVPEPGPKGPWRPALVSVTFRLAPQQRDKLARLGGEAWLREQIDRAALAPASD